MSMVRPNNYVNIQGWMITDLDLSGNDLLVYAIIYGFSQDDGSVFNGSLQYLADWCNATKRGVQKNLEHLVKLGYIKKSSEVVNGLTHCSYWCVSLEAIKKTEEQSSMGMEQSSMGMEQSSLYNIANNTRSKKELSKDNSSETEHTETIVKPVRKNLYEKCVDLVHDYCSSNNTDLEKALLEYLPIRLAIKEKPLRGINEWKGMLNKLFKMTDDAATLVSIVEDSTANGWACFVDPKSKKTFRKKPTYETFGETADMCNRKIGDDDDVCRKQF